MLQQQYSYLILQYYNEFKIIFCTVKIRSTSGRKQRNDWNIQKNDSFDNIFVYSYRNIIMNLNEYFARLRPVQHQEENKKNDWNIQKNDSFDNIFFIHIAT